MPHLRDLIASNASLDAIADHLDGLSADARDQEARSLGRDEQRRLYQKAESGPAITLDHFVPPGVAARREVRHLGRNTLPLPFGWKYFEKRFCRPESGTGRLFGYNEGGTRKFIGPGYYVAVPTAGNPAWEARGQIVVDYFQVPDGPVVDGWPEVVPNDQGLQRLVFHHTRDFMRRVSQHVSIGAAYKEEKALDHYFVLVRVDS